MNSLRSIFSLTSLGTSGITLSMRYLITRNMCSNTTKSKTQSRLEAFGAKACTSLSIDNRAKFVIIEINVVKLKALYQAPMSLTYKKLIAYNI